MNNWSLDVSPGNNSDSDSNLAFQNDIANLARAVKLKVKIGSKDALGNSYSFLDIYKINIVCNVYVSYQRNYNLDDSD